MNKYKFKQDKIFKINGVNVPSVHTLLKKFLGDKFMMEYQVKFMVIYSLII